MVNMAAGRACYNLRVFGLVCITVVLLTDTAPYTKLSLLYRLKINEFSRRAAAVRVPVLKLTSHGASVVVLPFDSHVSLSAYFAICCDVSSNPGPVVAQGLVYQD